jgi:hypothetical protein
MLPSGHCVISHREYLSDLAGTNGTAFPATNSTSYLYERINPSNPALFPWLSGMAGLYETYNYHKLKFEYVSTCSTSTPGYVILAIDYDPSDDVPTSKVQLLSYEGSVRCNSWNSVVHNSSRANLSKQKSYYCGYNSMHTTDNHGTLRTSDVGTLNVLAMGQTSTNFIGEIYVEYEVELKTPQMSVVATSMPSLQITMGDTLDFELVNDTLYYGNLNIIPINATQLRIRQGFIGVLYMTMRGSGITGGPFASVTAPNSAIQIGEVVNGALTDVYVIYKLNVAPNSVLVFSHGAALAVTRFEITFASLAQNTYDHLLVF